MKLLFLSTSLFLAQCISAQTTIPVIKATSKAVAINDDGYLDKNAWSLSPKTKLDVFTAERTRKTKWVTFITDIDSIRVKVRPGTKFNFVVLLNGTDSCYTQIASAIPSDNPAKSNFSAHDTIPFELSAFDAIHVHAILNGIDTVSLHFDIGSWDFRLTRDAIAKRKLQLSGPGKITTVQMGNIVWNNRPIGATGFTAREMEGRFGWNLFENRIVEIDYDKHLLIIHAALPKNTKTYTRSKLNFIHSFVCVNGTFVIKNKTYKGDFLLDTGSDQALILDSTWASQQNFPAEELKLVKTIKIKDPRGVQYETKTVLAPLFTINGFSVTDLPTMVLATRNPTGFPLNYLGDGLLKRFNVLLDFKNDNIYLKPNKWMAIPYKTVS